MEKELCLLVDSLLQNLTQRAIPFCLFFEQFNIDYVITVVEVIELKVTVIAFLTGNELLTPGQ